MTTSKLRAWLLAVAVLALAPGVAHACNEPTLQVSPQSAGPGDTVQYAITGLTPGGAYHLEIEGHSVASGTASSTVARGSFAMPDLGDRSTRVSVAGVVEHSDIEGSPTGGDTWPVSYNMDYRAPAPPPSGSQAPTTQPASSAQPVATAPGAQAPAVTSPSAPIQAETPQPAAGQPARTPARVRTGQPSRAAGRTVTTANASAVLSDAATSAMTSAGSRVPAGHAGAVSSNAKRAPAAARAAGERRRIPIHAWGSARVEVTGGITPSVLCALVLLLAGFAWGGNAFVRARSRRPAPWVPPEVAAEAHARDLLMEAELQEMLAEHRAREVLAEPEPEPVPDGADRRDHAAVPG